jgi:hypothetical protein
MVCVCVFHVMVCDGACVLVCVWMRQVPIVGAVALAVIVTLAIWSYLSWR